jgi:hypothetical protein
MSYVEAFQRVVAPTLQVELPTASTAASNLDPNVEEWWKNDLEVVCARSPHGVAARIQLASVVTTWKVDRLQKILPTASRVPDYSENPVIQQRLSHV